MNSKSLVLIVFAVWSVICWRWYVCGIMHACNNDTAEKEEVVAIRPEQESKAETPEIQPLEAEKSAAPPSTTTPTSRAPERTTQAPVTPSKPVSPANINEVQMEKVEDRMVIHFPYKSSTKEDNAAIDAYLEQLAQQLIRSGSKVSITGHTDFVGEPAENYQFGLRRAYGIRDILVKKGVPKSQIICRSSGDKKPVATNDTPYGRYLNRRAEIRIGK